MAFNIEEIQQKLEEGFAKIENEASATRPATKIVAETIAEAIEIAYKSIKEELK